MMRRLLSVVSYAAIVAVPWASRPIAGQVGQVWVEPRVGWLVPTRNLGRTDILGNAGFGVFQQVDQSAVLGLGAGVELGAGGRSGLPWIGPSIRPFKVNGDVCHSSPAPPFFYPWRVS